MTSPTTWVFKTRTKAEERNSGPVSALRTNPEETCRNDSFEHGSGDEAINLIQLRRRASPGHLPTGPPTWTVSPGWPEQAVAACASTLPCQVCWPTAPLKADRGERVRGCLAPKGSPHTPQADKGSPVPPSWAVPLRVMLAIVASFLQLDEGVPHTYAHRWPCFQECFLWRDTCLAGLWSRWPKPLGSRASSSEARPASAACGPGPAPAHNSPVTAPTHHLLQGRPCAPQNVWLIKTIMGHTRRYSFPAEVAELISTALSRVCCFVFLFCFGKGRT